MACSRMKPLWLARRCYSAAMPAWRPASALSASATSPQPTAAAHAAHSQHTVTHSSPALSARYIIPSRSVSWGTTQRIPKGRNHSCAAGSPVVAAATAEAAPQEQQSAPEKVAPISLPTSDESDDLLRIRHSASHIMAMALQKVFPDAQTTIGPWIDRGFYYDFDLDTPISSADLKAIKKEMVKIIKADLPFVCEEVSHEEAKVRMAHEPYKLELVRDILAKDPDAKITLYHIGSKDHKQHWYDLCAGPHVKSTRSINPAAIDLETVAGAYWRGNEKNKQLQRVYGTAWETKEQLKAYQDFKAEAERRDHRRLGAQLDLFSINDSGGAGLVFWHPKGSMVRHIIESYWKDVHLKHGYELIYSPHIAKVDLWKTSGHFDFYSENMYDQMKVEEEEYQLRPMNCPFHIAIYNTKQHSYRELPKRWAELGTVYRYERSGTMHGLFRVRGFTQDDAHIFCLPDQIATEIGRVLDLTQDIMTAFGFDPDGFEINLSTRPEKSVGSDDIWQTAELALQTALEAKGYPFVVDEGGGAFYGPKIDIKVRDAIGRKWQCSTVQLDFNLPERFDMKYVASDGSRQQPIMIHRAIFGSIERFFGILIENYAGAFPLWLAPVQVCMLLVSETDQLVAYANETAAELRAAGVRVQIHSGERLPKLIRTAAAEKYPITCIVGEAEAEGNSLAVRLYGGKDLGAIPTAEVKARVLQAVANHSSFEDTAGSAAATA
eukprot:CAMPEP_0206145366 /NCGR_PEP_ID=MMETSP1473-20131121/27127_1 /ASSEMBLY_ACC=CAM_ASM_001109 /TAXON_ID=1461547 /ORGANISM="Stichococcus sp, Strain RCC1054" /LENGTH=719 /DNA_ID=CAMNT_0053541539 /DNA_START=164 /DNA_END=2323 /DNA_ORIENTATION=+